MTNKSHRHGACSGRFAGTWYAIWETSVNGHRNINTETVLMKNRGTVTYLRNVSPSADNQLAGYLWKGQARLHHKQFLVGDYAASEQSRLYRGTLFYVVHPSGQFMYGRWVGCNYDRPLASGLSVFARSATLAEEKFIELSNSHRPRDGQGKLQLDEE